MNNLIGEVTCEDINNRDKMIKYLQEECKKRGEEIVKLKKN